ncbi:MAG: cyclic nucleotide-binding domain-containing protein [Rubrivivax sp.]
MNTPASAPTPLSDKPGLAQRAAEMLCTAHTMLPLDAWEAACVVEQMLLVHYPPRATVLREGDGQRSNFLLLILDGDVSVDTLGEPNAQVPIAVLGAGSIIGEMALLDGAPRSATCVAVSPVQAAGLSRQGLQRLIDEQPQVAVKLLIGLAARIAERLRAMADHLRLYGRLTSEQQAEIKRLREAAAR